MSYSDAKVYYDGSHYIAIPYVPNNSRKHPKPPEESITVEDANTENTADKGFDIHSEIEPLVRTPKNKKAISGKSPMTAGKTRQTTKKDYFEELYAESRSMNKFERKQYILEKMYPYFKDGETAELYVVAQFDRKMRNLVCRRTRLVRKVNLQEFNYFCTFTYDGDKHTEDSFKSKLKDCFKKMCYRRDWKYVGVWERSPEKQRLHFHGLFYIPEGKMPGELIEVKDYSPIKKKVQYTIQNTYFNERFGRSDFKSIDNTSKLGDAVAYLTKYIEKTGEKIVYSKGLPQFFISDIMDDDVVCMIGQEDRKLLLFDDFTLWDEGCYVGKVCPDTIKQMRKSN